MRNQGFRIMRTVNSIVFSSDCTLRRIFCACTVLPGFQSAVLSLQGPKEEVLDENEWWDRLETLKVATDQQEVVIKRNFGRSGQEILEDIALRLGLHL